MHWKTNGKLSLSVFAALALALSGCGGGGGGGDPVSSGGPDPAPAARTADVAGSIDLSALGSAGRVAARTASLPGAGDARVVLCKVGPNGELEPLDGFVVTPVPDPVDPNRLLYTFEDVPRGATYVVRYLQRSALEGKVIEMKVTAEVPEEGEPVAEEMNPVTSLLVEALVEAVMDAVQGTEIDDETVEQVIAAVKEAVATAVDNLVQMGAIDPAALVEVDGDYDADTVTESADEALATAQILGDPDVTENLDIVKNTATGASRYGMSLEGMTPEEVREAKASLIKRVFLEMVGDGGVPQFMVDFFTDVYVENATATYGQLAAVVADPESLWFDLEWFAQQGVSPPSPSAGQYVAAFNAVMAEIHALKGKFDRKLPMTADEKETLAEIPSLLFGLFPPAADYSWTPVVASDPMSVPQGIAFVVFCAEAYLGEQIEAIVDQANDPNIHDAHDVYEFEPFGIFELFEFDPTAYDLGLEIWDVWVHPGRMWDETSQSEIDVLNAGTCIEDMSNLMGAGGAPPDFTTAEVTLTYPTPGGGAGTIALRYDERESDPEEGCFRLDPWMEANPDNNGDSTDWIDPLQDPETQNRIVSDFTSGLYTVTVVLGGETHERSFEKKVITGMAKARPTLVEPAPGPVWPGPGATEQEWQAFNEAEQAYEIHFSEGVAGLTVRWEPPAADFVVVPEGVKMGYAVSVGFEGQFGWEPIWTSWDRDRLIFGNVFYLPIALETAPHPYNVSVDVVFVDSVTGEHLGQGGHSWAQFMVHAPPVLTDTFVVEGGAVDGYEVVAQRWCPDGVMSEVVATSPVVEGAYRLELELGAFLADRACQVQFGLQDPLNPGPMGWPDMDTGVWFNTRGGVLRAERGGPDWHESQMIWGGEAVVGPSFSQAPMVP